jgi:DNA-binding CsgD family transcriptional regulator
MDFNSRVELHDEHCYGYAKQKLIKILYINNSNVFMYRTHMDVKNNVHKSGE